MKPSGPKFLVLGAQGTIGSALYKKLKTDGFDVLGTSRQFNNSDSSILPYDLESNSNPPLPKAELVFICAGISNTAECRLNPTRSWLINVDKTIEFCRHYFKQGAFVVFLSTAQVFDGTKPFYEWSDPTNPKTEYGRQKEAVEKVLRQTFPTQTAVVRMTKVLSEKDSRFCNWLKALDDQLEIQPFDDLYFSPVSLELVTDYLIKIAQLRMAGIFHFGAEGDISYAEAMFHLANKMNKNSALIKPAKSREVLGSEEFIPQHMVLKTNTTLLENGMSFPSVQKSLEDVLCHYLEQSR